MNNETIAQLMQVHGNRGQFIRERAYQLWEADGAPEGRADEYWYRAQWLSRIWVSPRAAGMSMGAEGQALKPKPE